MKSGFTLIEILVAIALSTMISYMLFAVFFQTNRSMRVVDSYVDVYTKAAIVARQLERDIAGACVPWAQLLPDPMQQPAPKVPAQPGAKPEDKKPDAESDKKDEAKKSEKKKLKKLFYSASEGGNLKTLTFITNNPTAQYWSDQIGKPKPRLARVLYTVQKQPNDGNKESFVLKRQEGAQLDYGAYKGDDSKIRTYDVIDGIKNISVDFSVHVPEKKEDETKKIIKRMINWDSDLKEEKEDEKAERAVPVLPGLVTIKMQLWDQNKQRAIPFEFTTRILSDGLPPAESAVSQSKPPAPAKVDTQKPAESGAKQPPATGGAQLVIKTASIQVPVVPTAPAVAVVARG